MAIPRMLSARSRLSAFLLGVVAVYALRYFVNNTTLADRLVLPLLVPDNPTESDAIVALGGGVTGVCSPNLNSVRRVLIAADLYHQKKSRVVVFSGGPSDGAPCAVAWTMARLAGRLGIPERDILVEASSRSTHQNAERATPMLRAIGARRLLVVTDRLHLTRAVASFRHYGFQVAAVGVAVQDGHPNNADMLLAGLREYVALAYYYWRSWLDEPPSVEPSSEATWRQPGTALSHPPARRHPDGPVVVLGASYAAGWIPNLPGIEVLNRGVAGQQSSEVLGRFSSDVVAAHPRAVVVWGFINDVFRSPRESIDATLQQTQQNFLQMVEHARREEIELILMTEVTIREPRAVMEPVMTLLGRILGRSSYQTYINNQVLQTNAWLRGLAARERILLLDAEPVLAGPDDRRARRYAVDDGSHINAAGYRALSSHFEPVLTRHLEPEK